jgi:hypothetical protein
MISKVRKRGCGRLLRSRVYAKDMEIRAVEPWVYLGYDSSGYGCIRSLQQPLLTVRTRLPTHHLRLLIIPLNGPFIV